MPLNEILYYDTSHRFYDRNNTRTNTRVMPADRLNHFFLSMDVYRMLSLKSGQIDVGLVHLPFSDHELATQHLTEIQDCFVVGEAFRHMASAPIKQELDEGKLFQLHTVEPISSRSVGFATRRDSSLPLIAKRFTQLLG